MRLHRDEPLPDPTDCPPVIVLGGLMGAYEEDAHPWLVEEKRSLRAVVARGVPVLGVCLGAQLLADALGGRAYAAPASELGYHEVRLTRAGTRDTVLGAGVDPVLSWHGDTFDPPPGATLLARSRRHPHAFRAGSALAVQFHPEAGPALLTAWLRTTSAEALHAEGLAPEGVLRQARAREQEARATGTRLLRRWLDEAFPGDASLTSPGSRQERVGTAGPGPGGSTRRATEVALLVATVTYTMSGLVLLLRRVT